MLETDRVICHHCSSLLQEPYVACMECDSAAKITICMHCFAKGVEFDQHESNHRYEIVKNDFSLLDPKWTAQDELHLLEAIGDCGLGNWSDIANQVRTKNKFQCEHHYNECYINAQHPELPQLEEKETTVKPSPVVFKLCEHPPRPSEGSWFQQEMSGYMAARGDFNVEHNNYMEMDLRDLDFDNHPEQDERAVKEIKCAALDVYHDVLQERERRKKIIRDYGLIHITRANACMRRYEATIGPYIEKLKVFTSLKNPENFDKYLESLHYESQLKQAITQLQEYRAAGIKRLRSAKVYETLKRRRNEEKRKRHMLEDVLENFEDEGACQMWLHRQAMLDNISKGIPVPLATAIPRKNAPPLDILGMPGSEKLTEAERDLCSTARLVPESYLEFKKILINENNKHGFLRLAQARQMIKIDVNKTRRLYDFLVNQTYISKDAKT